MPSYNNTYDLLGDQATLDALLDHSLSGFTDDRAVELGPYAIYKQPILRELNFPSLTLLKANAINDCATLETLDIGKVCTIQNNAIMSCPKLTSLFLRGTGNISTLQSATALSGTTFVSLKGAIYVPETLLATYRSNTYWQSYKASIFPIDAYPVTDFSTISESWSDIKAAVQDESFFSGSYAVGDIKQFTYGTHTVYGEIRKIDATNKFVDFVIKNFDETCKMNTSSTMLKYADSKAKQRLDTIYADELPSDLKAVITPVAKKYYAYDGTTEEVTAPLWLLNTKDAGLTGSYLKDQEGEEYFSSNAERIKYNQQTGSANRWWLGSADSSSGFVGVSSGGNGNGNSPYETHGLVFGFRIQKSS